MLDPRNRSDVLDLAHRFTSFGQDDMDLLTMEYLDYRSCTDEELFDPHSDAAIHHFWAEMETCKLLQISKHYDLGSYHS